MARGNNNPSKNEAQVDETPAPVETVEVPAAEAVETPAPTEGEAAPATEKPAEEVPDLTAWDEATEAAANGADETTGDLALVFIEPVVKAYRALSTKGKKLAKKALQEKLREAVNARSMPRAKSYMTLNDAMVDGAASKKAEREPVDPTQAFVDRAVALRLATTIFTQDVPEGVKDEWKDSANARYTELLPQVEAYKGYLKAKADHKEGEPEVAEVEGLSDVVVAAFKVAQGRGGALPKAPRKAGEARAAFTGTRRHIGKHIEQCFARDEIAVGDFLTVAEIRSFKSAEYGDEEPSSGAISARLFPQSGNVTVKGVRPGEKDGKKGAFKA